jgi:hypothetical protein
MQEQGAGRRGWIAGGVIALVIVAFGVFVLPFAFTTPPPIITRFVATRVFSPGSVDGRAEARVAIRLSQPSNVIITIKDPSGTVVKTLADDVLISTKTFSVPWDGTNDAGARLPDGAYTLDLDAHAGQKKFSKSRKIVIDTTAPDAPGLTVAATRTTCMSTVTGPGEATRLQVTAVGTGAASDPRDLPAKGTFTWTWNRDRANGVPALGPTIIAATVSDVAGNRATTRRICIAAGKARVTP